MKIISNFLFVQSGWSLTMLAHQRFQVNVRQTRCSNDFRGRNQFPIRELDEDCAHLNQKCAPRFNSHFYPSPPSFYCHSLKWFNSSKKTKKKWAERGENDGKRQKRDIFFCSFCAFATVFAFPSSSTISFLVRRNFKRKNTRNREGMSSREEKIAESGKKGKKFASQPFSCSPPLQVKQRKLMNGGGLRMNRIFPKKKSGEQFPMLFFFHFSAAWETWWCSRTHLHSSIRPHSSPHPIFPFFFCTRQSIHAHTHGMDSCSFFFIHLTSHSVWRRFIVFRHRWSSIIHFGGSSEQMELLHRQLINDFQFFIHLPLSLRLQWESAE